MKKNVCFLFLTLVLSSASAADPVIPQDGLRAEMQGHWKEALASYKNELRAHPERADLWLRMADIYAKLKKPAEVARATAEAARLRPRDAALQSRLSQAYAMNNQPALALEAIGRAIKLTPNDARLLKAQAELAAWNRNSGLAETGYRAVKGQNAADAATKREIAKLQMQSGKLDEAVSSYAQYIRQYPEDFDAILEYADAQIYRGNFAAARALLDDYLQHAGETGAYRQHETAFLARAGRPDAAITKLQPLLSKSPDDYDLVLSQTFALNANRQIDEAQSKLPVLERLGPKRPETRGAALSVNTPQRSFAGAGAEYYSDSIPLSVFRIYTEGALVGSNGNRLLLEANRWSLRTDRGTGYEAPDGSLQGTVHDVWVKTQLQPLPELQVSLGLGATGSNEFDSGRLLGHIGLTYWASDVLTMTAAHQREPLPVSPKAAALAIYRDENRYSIEWRPDFRTTIEGKGAVDRYSDGNWRREFTFAPRFAVLRSEAHNLDLGASAQWLSYEHNYTNGYYAPENFQRYWGVAYYYWKISENNGLGVVLGAGPERDRQLESGFRMGSNLYAESVCGIYQDWQLRTYAGYGSRLDGSTSSGRPHGSSVGLELIRRF